MNKIESDLMEILHDILKNLGYDNSSISDIKLQTNLVESKVMDSVIMAELIIEIEDKFGIEIDTDEITPENFGTINSMANMLFRIKEKNDTI